jgi:glycosyltransferase involved in cell wall biosynthesis
MFSVIMPFFERPDLLRASLLAMQTEYVTKQFEVVVVDDLSRPTLKPVIPEGLAFDVTVVTLVSKNGINPCVPYNVGAGVAKGDYLVLTSPEIVPIKDILLEAATILEVESFKNNRLPYILFEVFGLTHKEMNREIISATFDNQNKQALVRALSKLRASESDFLRRGKDSQKPWSNEFGAWYQHSILKPSDLNFLSVIPRSLYQQIGGFCERFRGGTGYDDLNFRDRVKPKSKLRRVPGLAAAHLYHEEISARKELNTTINTNRNLYFYLKILRLGPSNSSHLYKTKLYPAIQSS